jgi:[acyl-carrier-protein] S-malonyltransferase
MSRDARDARLAFAFPGVGVRPCGHEAAFVGRHRGVVEPILAEASRFAGADLAPALADPDGGQSRPALTELQGQLLTYAFNVAVAEVCRREGGLEPTLLAGHSMGLYSALAAAGVVEFGDGLAIVADAFECVAAASAGLDAGMAVVVGLSRREVDAMIAARRDSVRHVNSNNDTTLVFSGLRRDLEAFLEEALARDALKARLLPVRAPYHHAELLAGASDVFAERLRRRAWRRASVPVVSSIDRRSLVEAEDLLDLTARNIATPIDWERVVLELARQRVELVVECGAGLSLSQNGRLIEGSPPYVTVKNIEARLGL